MTKMYYDNDANPDLLKNKPIAVIGYGIQGRGQSLCLRDSGCEVLVAELPGTANCKAAEADGFNPVSAREAADRAAIVQLLTQDTVQPAIYNESIMPVLTRDKALCFSHGFNINFKRIVPPPSIDVIMVAPKGPGSLVRKMYTENKGVPCLVAVHQNASGRARDLALAYARAIGGTRAGAIETTFREETETDLFGEQAVLCGGISELIKAGFDTLVNAGYQPEIAYFEVLHELKLITDLIQQAGISGMRRKVSVTACYGDLTRGKRVISDSVRTEMKKILCEIQDGKFADEWISEYEKGRPGFTRLLAREDEHPIEKVGRELRAMMEWMDK